MFLKDAVKIPNVPGKISYYAKGNATYVRYTLERPYKKDKQYNQPVFRSIGKLLVGSSDMMLPNENYIRYFGEEELPEFEQKEDRCKLLHIGDWIVIRSVMNEYQLPEILGKLLGKKNAGLFLDLAAYSIVTEDNAAQYYPMYAYDNAIFTEDMRIFSDSTVSRFLSSSCPEDIKIDFLNEWNSKRDHREKIYISYDSTNKHCQAGDIEMVEIGHPKDGKKNCPIFNCSIAYDTFNKVPLFYEEYPGSIVDVSQLRFMIDKAKDYGYKKVGFILDRGYFSKSNIQYMDKCGYDFVIMLKGKASLVHQLIWENKGSFEDKRACYIHRHRTYGTTIKHQLFASDSKERYFHLYYSDQKAYTEKAELESEIERERKLLDPLKGKVATIAKNLEKYFELEFFEKDGTFLFYKERAEVIERERGLCGYFVIITSHQMSAEDALILYKSRDESEKLFREDKSYLGDQSERVYSERSIATKLLIEFVALIIRNKIFDLLEKEVQRTGKKENFMTVPAAMAELRKITVYRNRDGIYRIDHAITATEKKILRAFGMDTYSVKENVDVINDIMSVYRKDERIR